MRPLRSMEWPVSHLLNPAFPYRPAAATDVRETFARVRAQMQQKHAWPGDYCDLPRDATASPFVRSKMK